MSGIKRNARYSLLVWVLVCGQIALAGQKVRVLIYSGANNHKWKETTPQIEQILKGSKVFNVETTEHPGRITSEYLGGFDVIVSDWNNFRRPELVWSDSARQAFLDFVRSGGGHVTVHAGGSSFNDWQEYHQIASYWAEGTGHGSYHEFTVKPTDAEHAITKGVEVFETEDELWHDAGFPDDITVLATAFSSKDKGGSGKDEPVLTVNGFGKGRCVNLMLGHDAKSMKNAGFSALLSRSVEWAGTGSVNDGLSFEETERSVALTKNGKVVWQFNYGKEQTKPYFHPLSLSDGTVLTWVAPPDHIWHYGLWFCWKSINGVNYWEENPATGKAAGTTEWENVQVRTDSEQAAYITTGLKYHEPGKTVVLTEKRTIIISAPDGSGGYAIDWKSEFTAVAERVEFSRTPLLWEKGGKGWGGYAGLSFRACKGVKDSRFTGTFGELTLNEGMFRYKDVAVEYSGVIDDKDFGVAILDHPENLNSPTPWYMIDDEPMDYFSPAVICYGPHVMNKGERLELKYGICVHPGRWDSKELMRRYQKFASGE
jgi:type 1 glutamine amidotransferase